MRDVFIEHYGSRGGETAVMLLTGDLGFGVLEDFARRFPRQFLNVGVAEQNMTAVATGLALGRRYRFHLLASAISRRCVAWNRFATMSAITMPTSRSSPWAGD